MEVTSNQEKAQLNGKQIIKFFNLKRIKVQDSTRGIRVKLMVIKTQKRLMIKTMVQCSFSLAWKEVLRDQP